MVAWQTWGEAYEQDEATSAWHTFRSFATSANGFQGDAYLASHHHSHYFQGAVATKGSFGIDWPSAVEHPLFYIGIYAVIGLANALVGIISVVAQYTGALRASRILFR